MLTIHLECEGRSARIGLNSPSAEKPLPPLEQVTASGRIKRVQAVNGQRNLAGMVLEAARLLEADPELDLHTAGRLMRDTTAVYLDPAASEPEIATDIKEVEVVYTLEGQEKERRPKVFRSANIDATAPLKIVRRLPTADCLNKFVFRGIRQLIHTDGLTFDFLHDLARSLQESKSMALLGAGPKGTGPLVLRDGGSPFRAFLYGEVEGQGERARYRLLLLLSDQELKRPSPVPGAPTP